jgi:RNA polymerase sigma factor, sigma-70 family
MGSIDLNWKIFLEKGDESSFSIIYNSHADDLFSYGISLGFQKESCKDAIQDTFYKLFISKNNLRHVENITAYIFKSFMHRLIDLSRKQTKGEAIESITDSFTINVTVLDDIIDSENSALIKEKVSSLLNNLTANQREVVYLKYMVGLEHKDIADILNIQEDSSRKLLYRAMEKLRKQVSDEDPTERKMIVFLLLLLQLL